MNVDQAYEVFRSQGEGLKDALAWTLENWDEASDRLLSKLRSLCANLAEGDRDGADALFWITHLFADRRDTRAFGPLCARLARERSRETWLGDAATESLTNVLISLYEDDLAPLTAIIWSQEADELVRGAAIEAFGYLVRCQKALPDAEAMAFLRTFYETGKPRGESWVWVAWSFTVARLGMTDLAANAARLFSRNWIDEEYTDIQDFQALLGQARAKPELVFEEEGLGPFGSALELVDLYLTDKAEIGGSEDAEEDNWGGDSTSPKEPTVNPTRDVGRNDPCPCGSGKKFKKCCLAA